MDKNPAQAAAAAELYKTIEKKEDSRNFTPYESLELCDQLIIADPDFAPVYAKRGKYLLMLGDVPAALRDLDKAAEMGVDTLEMYYFRARCLDALGERPLDMKKDLETVLAMDPYHRDAPARLGHYYFTGGRFQEAFEYYTEAINNETGDPMVYLRRAKIFMDEERYEYAIVDLCESQECNPHNMLVYYHRGECYEAIGAPERALRDYERAAFVDMRAIEPHYKMGCLHYNRGELDAAVKDFTMMVELSPNDAPGYYSRGIAYLAKEEYAAAAADLEHAFALAPTGEVCHMLSQAYYGLGDEEKGDEYYDKALALGFSMPSGEDGDAVSGEEGDKK